MAVADWLEVGRIGRPHGVKGWMHVESYTDPPERLLEHRDWRLRRRDGEPQMRRLAEGHEHASGMIVRLDGIDDRNAAALLQGCAIELDRSELPPLKPREYYQADLMGLEVMNLEGAHLGVVRHFVPTPGNLVMVVQKAGRDVWIPAVKPYLHSVDLEAGQIQVDWPAELEQ